MRKLATAIAVWFGAGYVPKGPGTAGAAAAVLCAAPFPQYINWLAVGSILPAIWAADVHAKSKGAKDPQEVVEFVGPEGLGDDVLFGGPVAEVDFFASLGAEGHEGIGEFDRLLTDGTFHRCGRGLGVW